MGVKDLWNILSPSCEKKSLWELEGLSIAIDLSSWIVDSQNVGDNSLMNMYLRNLFFRTSYLLLLGVRPIFVLEGKAPALKYETIAQRQLANKDRQQQPKARNGNRGRLNCLQKKCEELLLSLGVRCFKSEGEAEALCSRLNELGVVDAVISQDSDCFLYGAQTVLRNFTMSPTYTCDMYTMSNIGAKLGLGRHKLLALSLLCGCDYEAGVQGVGKQSAVKFLATLSDEEVLDRLRRWRQDDSYDSQSSSSQMSQEQKLEQNIRKKALLDPNFPSEEVILEFLCTRAGHLPSFEWMKPSLSKFMVIADRMLAWDEDYAEAKFLPLMSRWHLTHPDADAGLILTAVLKKRTVRGVASYELSCRDTLGGRVLTTVEPVCLVARAYPELHQMFLKSKEKPRKGIGGRKKKVQQECDLEEVENLMEKLNVTGEPKPPPKKAPKRRTKLKGVKGLQTIDKFFKEIPSSAVSNNGVLDHVLDEENAGFSHSTPIKTCEKLRSYHCLSDDGEVYSPLRERNSLLKTKSTSLENISVVSVYSKRLQQSMNFESFLDSSVDSAALDLSDIVNSIVSRKNCNPAVNMWTNKLGLK